MSVPRWVPPSEADRRCHDPELVFEAGERNHHISNTAYPIAHDTTWKPYRVGRERYGALLERAWEGVEDMCLYAHVPFCEVRCSFCEYTVVARPEREKGEEYFGYLLRELEMYRTALGTGKRTLHGFDIGGGTPSYVAAPLILELVERVRAAFRFAPGVDISIETTPRIAAAEPEKIRAYADAGIGRISMGVQVIQPDLLRALNRDGNGAESHRRAMEHMRAAGFRKVNLDLMYGFAGQSIDSWRATLEHAIKLDPEFITLYRMRYKLTRISHQASAVRMEAVREQAALAKQVLAEAGYRANPGKNTYSRIAGDPGTSDYLTRRVVEGMPYLGLGLGAQSFSPSTIGYNDGSVGKNLLPYFRSLDAGRLPVQDLYDLPLEHVAAKMVAVSFYFGEIDRAAFAARFGCTVEEVYPRAVEFVVRRGLMAQGERCLSLTPEGARHFNGVIAQFFAPSVQEYLIGRDPETATDMARAREMAVRVGREVAEVAR